MNGSVQVDQRGRVATVTFDNRDKRNALNPPIIAELSGAFEDLGEREDVRAVVLTAAGEKAFSAGRDLTYDPEDDPDEYGEAGSFGYLDEVVKDFDFPTIAMLNGGAYGGAMALIAACDFRIAVEEAEFAITPAKLGLVYPGDAIYDVMSLVGPANVKEFLLTADPVDAQRAYDMGLLNRVVPRDEIEETTYELAESVAANAPFSLTSMKQVVDALVDKGRFTDAEERWAMQLREASEESDDFEEGVAAFREGREPEFTGE